MGKKDHWKLIAGKETAHDETARKIMAKDEQFSNGNKYVRKKMIQNLRSFRDVDVGADHFLIMVKMTQVCPEEKEG